MKKHVRCIQCIPSWPQEVTELAHWLHTPMPVTQNPLVEPLAMLFGFWMTLVAAWCACSTTPASDDAALAYCARQHPLLTIEQSENQLPCWEQMYHAHTSLRVQ